MSDKCQQCGSTVVGGTVYCTTCGSPMPTAKDTWHVETMLAAPSDTTTARPAKGSPGLVIALLAVGVLVVALAVTVTVLVTRPASSTIVGSSDSNQPAVQAAATPPSSLSPSATEAISPPAPTLDPALAAAGVSYQACVAHRNNLVDGFTNTPDSLGAGVTASAGLAEADALEITCLEQNPWPSPVQPLVTSLIGWRQKQQEYDQRAAAATSLAEYDAIYLEPYRAVTIKQGAQSVTAQIHNILEIP